MKLPALLLLSLLGLLQCHSGTSLPQSPRQIAGGYLGPAVVASRCAAFTITETAFRTSVVYQPKIASVLLTETKQVFRTSFVTGTITNTAFVETAALGATTLRDVQTVTQFSTLISKVPGRPVTQTAFTSAFTTYTTTAQAYSKTRLVSVETEFMARTETVTDILTDQRFIQFTAISYVTPAPVYSTRIEERVVRIAVDKRPPPVTSVVTETVSLIRTETDYRTPAAIIRRITDPQTSIQLMYETVTRYRVSTVTLQNTKTGYYTSTQLMLVTTTLLRGREVTSTATEYVNKVIPSTITSHGRITVTETITNHATKNFYQISTSFIMLQQTQRLPDQTFTSQKIEYSTVFTTFTSTFYPPASTAFATVQMKCDSSTLAPPAYTYTRT